MSTIKQRRLPNFEFDVHVKRIEMRETILGKTKTKNNSKTKRRHHRVFFFRWVGLYFSTLVNAERIHTKEKKTFSSFNAPSLKRKKKMKYKQPKTTIRECKAYHKSDKKNTNGSRNLFDGFK